jgi:23S rRNA pseudouridine2605 synthase
LHKPDGVICTADDPGGRETAESLLPRKDGIRWISVGRLDINTSGLLLFTNNGDLAHRLMHPRYAIDREYAVRVFGDVDADTLSRLRSGIDIDGEHYAFEDVVRGNGRGANRWYYCVVRQGRNREVRRVWESQGVQVSRLIRSRFGNIMLPRDLKAGAHFEVKGVMLDDLFRLVQFQGSRSN